MVSDLQGLTKHYTAGQISCLEFENFSLVPNHS